MIYNGLFSWLFKERLLDTVMLRPGSLRKPRKLSLAPLPLSDSRSRRHSPGRDGFSAILSMLREIDPRQLGQNLSRLQQFMMFVRGPISLPISLHVVILGIQSTGELNRGGVTSMISSRRKKESFINKFYYQSHSEHREGKE